MIRDTSAEKGAEAPSMASNCIGCGRSLAKISQRVKCTDCGSIFCSERCAIRHIKATGHRRRIHWVRLIVRLVVIIVLLLLLIGWLANRK